MLLFPFDQYRCATTGRMTILLAVALFSVEAPAEAQSKAGSRDKSAIARRIDIEKLITAAPLPEGYSIARENFLNGKKLVGHKLLMTKEGALAKVIVQIENRKVATDEDKRAAAKDYVLGVMQSFREAGLRAVEKKLPEIDKNDFKKRALAEFIYERPEDGSRLFVQMQLFFTDRGHAVLIISDNEADHALLTRWARSVMPR